MGDIALVNGDIVISKFGDISIVADRNDDIIQQAINNIHTISGEMIRHRDIGNEVYIGRHKITDDMSDITSSCESAIMQDARIASVDSITARSESDGNSMIDISFLVSTIYGDILSSSTVITLT